MSCTLPPSLTDLYRAQIAAAVPSIGFFDSSQIGSATKLIPIDQLPISHLDLNEEEKMSVGADVPQTLKRGLFLSNYLLRAHMK